MVSNILSMHPSHMGVSWFRQIVSWIQTAVEWRPNCQKKLTGNKLSFAA